MGATNRVRKINPVAFTKLFLTAPALRTVPLAVWLARLAWLCAVGQAVGGLWLAQLNRLSAGRWVAEYVVAQTTGTLAFASVGLLIVRRRPDNIVGRLLMGIGLGFGLTCWLGQYARYTLVTEHGALPWGGLVAWLMFWTWIPVLMLLVVGLPLVFPRGCLPSRRWRPAVALAVVATALLSFELAVMPGPLDASLPEVDNPYAQAWAPSIQRVTRFLTLPLVLCSMAAAVASLVVRFRRTIGDERQQIKWFGVAIVALVAALVVPAALAFPHFTEDTTASGAALTLAYLVFPTCVGVAILRYRLYEIDLLINRALVYLLLSGSIAGLYIVVVGVLGAFFAARGGTVISLLAAGLVAVVFQPLRHGLQRGVNRLMFGDRDDPYRVLTRLGQRLGAAMEPDEVLPAVVATVRDALRLPYVAVALRRDDGMAIAAEEGNRQGDPLIVSLAYGGNEVGQLLVGARSPAEGWSRADRRLLHDLAYHAGAAVHGVWVMSELRRARESLVLAREEERRRLRRDLHDGIAPSIAALGLGAATVGELLPERPEDAATVVLKLQAAIRSTVGDVRRLVYDLRPPTLDELGLIEAIREHIVRLGMPGSEHRSAVGVPRIELDVPAQLPPLPAAVEVAAFRLVQEALHNVMRHAQAARCVVRLRLRRERELLIDVIDDGVGLPAAYTPGVGLRSMRERTVELGGVWTVERCDGGGTWVAATLPLAAVAESRSNHAASAHPHR